MTRNHADSSPMAAAHPTIQPLWLVVRRPELRFDTDAHHPLKVIETMFYQGVDRLCWWDLGALYWARQLRDDLVPLYEDIRATGGPTVIKGTTEYDDALRL